MIKKVSIIIFFLYLIIGIWTLPRYGINWDTINHLPRGQAYLHYFLTGNKNYDDLPKWKLYWQKPESLFIDTDLPKGELLRRSIYQNSGVQFDWLMDHDGGGHPPLSDILSSLFNKVIFINLGLINDIDSYRIYGIFLSSILVSLIFAWASRVYGFQGGIVAALSLALYPLFWSESHFNNEKDIPETVYWSLMIFFVWRGVVQKKVKDILVSGIFFGLALGTKLNIIFVPLVILPWIIVYILNHINFRKAKILNEIKKQKKLILAGLFVPFIGFGIFIFTWPYLWQDPVARILKVAEFYKSIGTTKNVNSEYLGFLGINTYPIEWILYTTPLVILFFALIGILSAFNQIKKEKDQVTLLFLLWLTIPVIRVIIPGSNIYGGIRQIMEFVPALALISGLGAQSLYNFLIKFRVKNIKLLAFLLILTLFIPLLVKLVSIHPNENVYFNPIIGGLKGAREENIPGWGNTFGSAYRDGVVWINKNVEKKSKLVFVYEHSVNIPRIFLRQDINLQNSYRSGYLMLGEYAITLNYQGVIERSYFDLFLQKYMKPIYISSVDGVPVVEVWKNDAKFLKKPLRIYEDKTAKIKTDKEGILISLDKLKNLWRLEIKYNEKDCFPLKNGTVSISKDGSNWYSFPVALPISWVVSILGEQPKNGSFSHPFAGDNAKYIRLSLNPENTCLKKVENFKLLLIDE